MWSESSFPAQPCHQRAPSAGARPFCRLTLSVRLVMKMSVILCNVMWGTLVAVPQWQEWSSWGDGVMPRKYTFYSTLAVYNVVSRACTWLNLQHKYVSIFLLSEYLHRMETEEAQEMSQMPGKRLPTAWLSHWLQIVDTIDPQKGSYSLGQRL